jgi:hypothetical protein
VAFAGFSKGPVGAASQNHTCTLVTNTTPQGNYALVFCVNEGVAGGDPSTVTDSNGTSYTQIGSGNLGTWRLFVYGAPIPEKVLPVNPTVTYHSGTATVGYATAVTFSGRAHQNPAFIFSSGADGSSVTSHSISSVSTPDAGYDLVAFASGQQTLNTTWTAGTGWSRQTTGGGTIEICQTQDNVAIGTYTDAFSSSAGRTCIDFILALAPLTITEGIGSLSYETGGR